MRALFKIVSSHEQRLEEEKKLEAEQAGEFRRQYHKKLPYRSCNKCFEDRNTGGHKQYYGNWWCAFKSSESYEEWTDALKLKGY